MVLDFKDYNISKLTASSPYGKDAVDFISSLE